MKKFLSVYGAGMLLFSLVSWGISAMSPRGWGNGMLREKLGVWSEKGTQSFNSVLLGSSHVYRQINPLAVDSIAAARGIPLRTYNLGSPATGNLENFPIAEYLIEQAQPADGMQVIIVELLDLAPIQNHDLIARWNYHWTFSELMFFVQATRHENIRLAQRLSRIWKACLLWFSGQLHINHEGLLAFVHPFFARTKTEIDKSMLSLHAGWYSLEDESMDTKKRGLIQRNRDFLELRAQNADYITLKLNRITSKKKRFNPVVLERLQKIIRQARAKGIHCFFVTLPPTFFTVPNEILNDPEWGPHFIELSSPEKWPEFYETRALFDEGHLNNWGSKRLTELLAEETLNRLREIGVR